MQGAITRKGYSTFPKAPASLEPHPQVVECHISRTLVRRAIPLCREAISVFYSPCRLGNKKSWPSKWTLVNKQKRSGRKRLTLILSLYTSASLSLSLFLSLSFSFSLSISVCLYVCLLRGWIFVAKLTNQMYYMCVNEQKIL